MSSINSSGSSLKTNSMRLVESTWSFSSDRFHSLALSGPCWLITRMSSRLRVNYGEVSPEPIWTSPHLPSWRSWPLASSAAFLIDSEQRGFLEQRDQKKGDLRCWIRDWCIKYNSPQSETHSEFKVVSWPFTYVYSPLVMCQIQFSVIQRDHKLSYQVVILQNVGRPENEVKINVSSSGRRSKYRC
jgi:hypothetical protein